jgi:dienelactone hydrolase
LVLSVAWVAVAGAQQTSKPQTSNGDNNRPALTDILAVISDAGQVEIATSPDQWQPRRQAILVAMQSVMGMLPRGTNRRPPEMTVLEEVDCETYTRKKITYESQPGCQTPAYLCIPKAVAADPSRPVSAALCLHPTDDNVGHDVVVGLGGKPNRQYASELAERGYVTLSPSYPLLANYQPDLKQLGWESGTLKAVWDNIRGVDLLQSLPFVDGRSIVAIGHSLGGHNAVYTAAFDDRIQAVVSSCGLDSYRDYYGGDASKWLPGKGWTQRRYMPRLAQYHGRLEQIPFDFDQILAAIAPRSVLVIAPLHDSNFRADSVDRITHEARKVFNLYRHGERLGVLHPNCDHDFPPQMRQAAYQMFDAVLGRVKERGQ